MQKLIVVAEHVCEAQSSTGYFWSKLIEKLASTTVMTCVITTAVFPKICNQSGNNRVTFIKLPVKKYDKNRLITRFIGQVRLALSFVFKMGKNLRSNDIVITGTNPALFLVALPWMKIFFRFRWHLLIHDVFPENLVPAKLLNKNSLVYLLLNRYFIWVYSKADLLYVIGRDMEQLVKEKVKNIKRVIFIPNWVDENDVAPISKGKSQILNHLKWQDKVVFQFFGNIGRLQGIENLLHAISLVKSREAAFLFIGEGAKAQNVVHFCNANPSINIHFYGSIDQVKKNEGLAACDVALVTLDGGMEGLGVPSKSYFSMAADKPILAVMSSNAEISIVVKENKIGWICEPSNPVALAAVMDRICSEALHLQVNSPRKVFVENFSAQISLPKLIATLDLD